MGANDDGVDVVLANEVDGVDDTEAVDNGTFGIVTALTGGGGSVSSSDDSSITSISDIGSILLIVKGAGEAAVE